MPTDLSSRIILFIIAATVLGCGAKREYLVSEIQVERRTWDTLEVAVLFEQRTTLGGTKPIESTDTRVRVLGRSADTLYEGTSLSIPILDERLGDREQLLVEVCGRFGAEHSVCGQHGLSASPKRIMVEHEIDYPLEDDYDRGKYRFEFSAERQVLDADSWDPIPWTGDRSGYLIVQVDGEDGDGIVVRFEKPSGEFKLTNLRNNADFRRQLLGQLLADTVATIVFQVHSNAFAVKDPVARIEKTVESKTLETRELEAGYFVEEVSRRLFDMLRTFPIGRDRWFFMNSWSFDKRTRSYVIDLEMSWVSSFIRTRWFELGGILRVRENGEGATFELRASNERGRRRWNQRFDGPVSEIGDLTPFPSTRRTNRRLQVE